MTQTPTCQPPKVVGRHPGLQPLGASNCRHQPPEMFHHHHQLWLTPMPPEESFHLCHWPSSIQNHLALTGLDYLNCCLAPSIYPWTVFLIHGVCLAFFHGHSSHSQLWCSIPRWISPEVWHHLRGNQQALLQFDVLIYMTWYNIFEVKTIKELYFTFNCHSLHLILDVFMSDIALFVKCFKNISMFWLFFTDFSCFTLNVVIHSIFLIKKIVYVLQKLCE